MVHCHLCCVCGKEELLSVSSYIYHTYPNTETDLYSGREEVEDDIYEEFDYVKLGPYNEKLGTLNKRTTNQRMYRIYRDGSKEDITNRFCIWKIKWMISNCMVV